MYTVPAYHNAGIVGGGGGSSSNMTTVFLMCMGKTCTLSAVLLASHPLQPLTGPSCRPIAVGNDILYISGSHAGWEVSY